MLWPSDHQWSYFLIITLRFPILPVYSEIHPSYILLAMKYSLYSLLSPVLIIEIPLIK